MDKQKQIEEMSFIVIDNKTGKEADIGKIALKEDWAKGLMYCDMEGFALLQDGNLILMDECGRYEYCPSGRFTVVPEGAVVLTGTETEERLIDLLVDFDEMSFYPATTTPNPDEYAREWKRKLIYAIGQLQKETAEKFAEKLKKEYFWACDDDRIFMGGLRKDIDEICKELAGVK